MKSRSGLFLIELILAILFFTLSATVCVQMFVKSSLLGNNTEELDHAIRCSQNIAEVFRSCHGDPQHMALYLDGAIFEDDSITLHFDKNWNAQSTASDGYTMICFVDEKDTLKVLNLSVIDDQNTDQIIYELTVEDFGGGL